LRNNGQLHGLSRAKSPAMSSNDTIAAIATAPGTGGIGVVRVSGKKTKIIAERIIGELPTKRTAVTRTFINAAGDSLDAGLALYFQRTQFLHR
jgi:tRNA modification GTPase